MMRDTNETYRLGLDLFHWLDEHATWIPLKYRVRAAFWVARVRTRHLFRLRRWLYRWERFRLWARVRPLWVAYHGYCCDTGPYTWTHRFRWQGWRWPGLLAWQATTADNLCNLSDGPTDYSVVDQPRETVRCDGCGAGNAPYGSFGMNLCLQCQYHEQQADAY